METCKNAEIAGAKSKQYLHCKLTNAPCKFQRYCNLQYKPLQTEIAKKACKDYK